MLVWGGWGTGLSPQPWLGGPSLCQYKVQNTVLYCIELYYIVLYYTALQCTVLYTVQLSYRIQYTICRYILCHSQFYGSILYCISITLTLSLGISTVILTIQSYSHYLIVVPAMSVIHRTGPVSALLISRTFDDKQHSVNEWLSNVMYEKIIENMQFFAWCNFILTIILIMPCPWLWLPN